MIAGLFNNGAMPVLERVLQFTQARHGVLADNIANVSTPYFKSRDLDPGSFQATLRDAIDRRREGVDPAGGALEIDDTDQLKFRMDGLDVRPGLSHEGVLFHDQNDRDMERTMQHLAENTLAHNSAVELMRNEFSLLLTAIRERV